MWSKNHQFVVISYNSIKKATQLSVVTALLLTRLKAIKLENSSSSL